MAPAYKTKRKNGTSPHSYHCIGDHHGGGRECGHRPGRPIDTAVVDAILTRLEPPAVEVLRELWRQARRDAVAVDRLQGDELRRAEREAEDLLDRFVAVDVEHRLVREAMEQRLENAKSRVLRLRERGARFASPPGAFTDESFQELLALATKLPVIWSAATTTDLDRKEIIRALIRGVYVDAYDAEHIALTITWADGAATTSCEVILPPRAHRLIRQLAAEGTDASLIAEKLTLSGILTKYGTAWHAKAVQRALNRMMTRRRREPVE